MAAGASVVLKKFSCEQFDAKSADIAPITQANLPGTKSCERCGKHMERPRRLANTQWETRRFCSNSCGSFKRSWPDLEAIRQYEKGHSSTEIGKTLGISPTTIIRILKQNGIRIRPSDENKKLSHANPKTIEKMRAASTGRAHSEASKDKLRQNIGPRNAKWRNGLTQNCAGYLMFTRSAANGTHAGKFLHQIIAEWSAGRLIEEGEHVHHIDGNKTNNSPENLVILSASEHAKLHTEDRNNGRKKKC